MPFSDHLTNRNLSDTDKHMLAIETRGETPRALATRANELTSVLMLQRIK